MKLVTGRPIDVTKRLEKEIKVYDLLDELGIDYKQLDHEEVNTMEACYEIDRVLDTLICKNLFLCNRQKTKFYLLMIPGEKPFKTKELCKQIDSARLSFAEPSYMEEFLNIKPGSVSVMGLMNDVNHQVKLIIDKAVVESETIGCHPCVNTSSLKLRTKDVLEKFLPHVMHAPIYVDLPKES